MTTPTFSINYAHSANLLFSTRFAGITINNPDSFSGNQVWRHITGTDTVTGFSHTDLAAAPLFVQPPGGGTTGNGGYGLLYINQVTSPPWPTNDLAGVENKCQTTNASQTIRGVPTNYIKMNWSDTGAANSYTCQSWLCLYRDLNISTGDLPVLFFREWITLQDHSTLFDATNRYRTLVDIKCGNPAANGGDHRLAIGIMRSNAGVSGWYDEDAVADGTMGWFCNADNNANRDGWGTPTFPKAEYFRVKNFSVPVPVNEGFWLEVYYKRAASYTDYVTGRVRIVMRTQSGAEYVLFDITQAYLDQYNADHPYPSPTAYTMYPMKNILKGFYNDELQRIFLAGAYFGGLANKTVNIQVAALDIYDDIPYYLPAAD